MSRTLVTEYGWDYHFDPGTNIVDVVITGLRKKLDHGREPKLIHTVRGVGYVVKASRADAARPAHRLVLGRARPYARRVRRGVVRRPPQRVVPGSRSADSVRGITDGGHSRRELPCPRHAGAARLGAAPRAHPRSGGAAGSRPRLPRHHGA